MFVFCRFGMRNHIRILLLLKNFLFFSFSHFIHCHELVSSKSGCGNERPELNNKKKTKSVNLSNYPQLVLNILYSFIREWINNNFIIIECQFHWAPHTHTHIHSVYFLFTDFAFQFIKQLPDLSIKCTINVFLLLLLQLLFISSWIDMRCI